MNFQKTLKKKIYLQGIGIHRGENVNLIMKPSPENSGILFKIKNTKIKATPNNISSTNFNTTLQKNNIKIQTTEHLLAALYGLQIDNVEIEIDNLEIPIFDGSAKYFADKILSSGYKTQRQKKKIATIKKPIYLKDNDKMIIALPSGRFQITYFLDHPHNLIGKQLASFEITKATFLKEIAPARTFASLEEAMKIKDMGLAMGGSLENAVIVGDKIFTKLRFKDEMARHKILDIIGDMAILGSKLYAHIIGIRTGHFQNQLLCKKIYKHLILS